MSEETPVPNPVLEQLGAELAGIEAASAPPPAAPGTPGAPVPVDYQAECSLLVTFAFDTLTPFYPNTCGAWSPEKRTALVAACVPLATKYGFTLGSLFDRWGPEIGLAMVVLPMVGPTMAGLRADRKLSAVEQGATVPRAPIPPGQAPIASTVEPPPPSDVQRPDMPKFNLGDGMVIG